MKVAYFAFSERFGAPDAGFVHTYNIVKNPAKLVDVRLFIKTKKTVKDDFEVVNVIMPTVKNILRISPIKYLKSYLEIRGKTKDADIIHERFHVNPVDLLFVGNKKYVLEVNDPGIETWTGLRRIFYPPLVKLKFKRCSAIITQTETLKGIIRKHTDKPIYVVPNGVDLEKFNPSLKSDIRERYGVEGDEVLVTYAGSFREWHGVQDIPKIAEEIKDHVRFLLVGSGPLFNEIREKCKGNKKLILAGVQPPDAMPKFLAASDILIAPFNMSKFKQMEKYGFWWSPVKLYEYMASGRAIVSYDFEEVRRIVRDAGLLAEPGNRGDFTEKISLLAEDEELRIKLGRRGRSIAEEEYSWKKRAGEVLDIYKGLANHA
jgi:glycosyltransferase involved in cell wall biosynthesis